MKYVGIDFGTTKTGIAVSDDTGTLAFPRAFVDGGMRGLPVAVDIIREARAEAIVVGDSKNHLGLDNPVMKLARDYADSLAAETGLPIHWMLESHTSAQARRTDERERRPIADKRGHTHVGDVDASAAAIILQSFLDRLKA